MGDQLHSFSTLSQPLTPTVVSPNDDECYHNNYSISSSTSSSGIAFRLVFLFLIASLSIWASYESSKGFNVTIVNQLSRDSPAGERFDLFYVSNDRATRVLLNTSQFVENLLYDDNYAKKPVSHVTLRLSAGDIFSGDVDVFPSGSDDPNGFVIDISPTVMDASDVDRAMTSAVLRGMALVWLWDGESSVPPGVLSGVVEYIATAAGFGREGDADQVPMMRCCHEHGWYMIDDARSVARLLGYCEEKDKGFIKRLNGAMRSRWHDRTVDDVLGKPAEQCLCVPADHDHNYGPCRYTSLCKRRTEKLKETHSLPFAQWSCCRERGGEIVFASVLSFDKG